MRLFNWLKKIFFHKRKSTILNEQVQYLLTKNVGLEEKIDELNSDISSLRKQLKIKKQTVFKAETPQIIANGTELASLQSFKVKLPTTLYIK